MSDPRFLSSEPYCACVYRPPAPDGSDFASAVSPLLAIAQECSPRYERHRNDLVSIDVSGLDRLMRPRAGRESGPPRSHWKTIGEELRRAAAARGVRVHVAVAATQTTALVLAQVRPGVTIVEPAQQAEALASVPIGILERIPGVPRQSREDPRTDSAIAAVKRWGLHTLGELAALPTASLTARLGREAIAWQAIARGDDLRPLVPELPEERFENSLALEWPIEGLEPLSIRLERRDRGAAVLHVLLRLVTRETHVRRLQLPSPIRDVRTLRTLALLDLESHPPRVALMGSRS